MPTCPRCNIQIANETVLFSCGQPGTRARLYARVCSHAIAAGRGEGCINRGFDGELNDADFYGDGRELRWALDGLPGIEVLCPDVEI